MAVIRLALVLVGAWLLVVLLAWTFQRQLIFLPDSSAPTPPAGVEELRATTSDGLEVTSWFVPADGAPLGHVAVTPGNAGNRALRLPLAAGLAARGYDVLLVDYRGYGGNPGRPSEAGLYADALAAHEVLVARDGVDPDRVVILGESIGTAPAAFLAAERGPAALVLRSPFPDLGEVGARAYPFLPVRTLLRDRFEVGDHLDAYDGPVLVVAGGADRIVPEHVSRMVQQRHSTELLLFDDAGHNDRALLDGDDYLDAVAAFFEAHLAS